MSTFRPFLAGILAMAFGIPGWAGSKPNLLVFLVDDMGTQDTSEPFHYEAGSPVVTDLNQRYRTPHIETLADQGRKFLRAYAAPVCTPSRVSLMTGMNTVRHHVTNYTFVTNEDTDQNSTTSHNSPANWRTGGIDETDITLPSLLQDAGYRTILVGKGHFGPRPLYASDPTNFGFDVNIGGSEIGRPKSYLGDYGQGTDRPVPHLEAYHHTGTHLTEALTLEMKQAITDAVGDGKPFFAYMTHYAVHSPFEVDTRFAANYPGLSGEPLAFATLIEGMDKSLGDLMTHLESLGVAEDTLVIFLSDNGSDAPIGLNNTPPLRGRKGNRWEGGIRIPMLAAWAKADPANPFQVALPIPGGTVVEAPVAIFDWFPTLLHIAGVPFSHSVDGMDLRPILTGGEGDPDREILIHFPHDHRNDYFTVLRAGDWKLHYLYAENRFELYRLDQDVGESTDTSGAEPVQLMRMARRMARLLDAGDAQWPTFSSGADDPIAMPDLPPVDADGDGLPDLDEDANGNGLRDPGETEPDDADTDGDRTDDRTEIRLGLDPLDPLSAFRVRWSGTGIDWPSRPGTLFRVEIATPPGGWQTLVEDLSAGEGGVRSGIPLSPQDGLNWFRVLLTN